MTVKNVKTRENLTKTVPRTEIKNPDRTVETQPHRLNTEKVLEMRLEVQMNNRLCGPKLRKPTQYSPNLHNRS